MEYNTQNMQQIVNLSENEMLINPFQLSSTSYNTPGTGMHQLVSVSKVAQDLGNTLDSQRLRTNIAQPPNPNSHLLTSVAINPLNIQNRIPKAHPIFDEPDQSSQMIGSQSFEYNKHYRHQEKKKRPRTKKSIKEEIDSADTKSDGSMDKSKGDKKSDDMDIQEKNRENARNTRLRKKIYIEKLKQTIAQLGAEREIWEAERKKKRKKEEEKQASMFQIVQTWFFYRSSGDLDREKWSEIIDERCIVSQPITPYRSFDAREVSNNCRIINGIEAMIADTASLQVLIQTIGQPSSDQKVQLNYYCFIEDTVIVGDSLMCRWMMRTVNAVQCGGLCELYNHGMLRAEFSPENVMVKIDLMFDVMSFMQQLQRCSGREYFHMVPNTVAMAKQSADEPRMVVSASKPYKIIYVNSRWSTLFGYSLEEVYMKGMAIIDGGQGDSSLVAQADEQFPLQRAYSFLTKTNSRYRIMFPNYLCFYPLANEGNMSHYLVVFNEIK